MKLLKGIHSSLVYFVSTPEQNPVQRFFHTKTINPTRKDVKMSKKINKKVQNSWYPLVIVLVFFSVLIVGMVIWGYFMYKGSSAEDTPRSLSEMDSTPGYNYYRYRDSDSAYPSKAPSSSVRTDLVALDVPHEICGNGLDDDRDGYRDCADADCMHHAACQPDPENCTDGIDNDGDGALDCDDLDCKSHAACKTPKLAPAWKTLPKTK